MKYTIIPWVVNVLETKVVSLRLCLFFVMEGGPIFSSIPRDLS